MTKTRTILRLSLMILLGASFATGCAGKDTFQNKLKGLWVLESRTLPGGETVTPPAISGRLEWFPSDPEARTAHVSVLMTHGDGGLQVHGSNYDLGDYQQFTQTSYLEVGGGLATTPGESYEVVNSTRNGTLTVEGSTITLNHDSGPTYIFKGSQLTIEHPDGTTDVLTK